MISKDKLQSLVDRLERIEHEMSAAPESDAFVRLSREHAEVAPVAAQARELLKLRAELDETRAMLEDPATDREMAALAEAEAHELEERAEQMEHGMQILLLPRDMADEKGAILEIRAGTGGDEAALFAGDLLQHVPALRRYLQGWRVEVILSASSIVRRGAGSSEVVAERHRRAACSPS